MMIRRACVSVLKAPFHVYRLAISPLLASNCRFQPTCSAYALEALDTHRVPVALKLILRRVLRCRPGGAHGFDPVPPAESPQKP
jgi:putative membrane protein insertion efficiency factor